MEAITIIMSVMALFTVTATLFAVLTYNRTIAILSAGIAGLFASIIYVILAAPDVAMTEASIGSGLTTFIFFFTLKKIREDA